MLENQVDYDSDVEALVVGRNDYAILVLFLSFVLHLVRHIFRRVFATVVPSSLTREISRRVYKKNTFMSKYRD